jgi:hypothetical protein
MIIEKLAKVLEFANVVVVRLLGRRASRRRNGRVE